MRNAPERARSAGVDTLCAPPVRCGATMNDDVVGPEATGADHADTPRRARRVRCAACGAPAAWEGDPNRPFCSFTCRLVDLGVWLDGRYRSPAQRRAAGS